MSTKAGPKDQDEFANFRLPQYRHGPMVAIFHLLCPILDQHPGILHSFSYVGKILPPSQLNDPGLRGSRGCMAKEGEDSTCTEWPSVVVEGLLAEFCPGIAVGACSRRHVGRGYWKISSPRCRRRAIWYVWPSALGVGEWAARNRARPIITWRPDSVPWRSTNCLKAASTIWNE